MTDVTESIRHVVITGRVQGVGFRAFLAGDARRRALTGWVRNRRDLSVEALFAGDAAAVDAMVAACQSGPGRVDHVTADVGTADMLALRGGELFATLPTS